MSNLGVFYPQKLFPTPTHILLADKIIKQMSTLHLQSFSVMCNLDSLESCHVVNELNSQKL